MKEEFFKISSGLKNLIGSELITDNFVAVFELVKNSFDANATEVKIRFENIYSKDAKIIIQDNGKGMDYNDLVNKWLFVAYSAKRDNTEDEEDYRNKIKPERFYAGAKGVGRFSCDRLGRQLNLITIKNKPNSKIENLKVDWRKFEEDQKKQFITIPVEHTVLKTAPYNLKRGTILEITGINVGDWSRDNLLKLKDKLSKLVRPDLNESIKEKKFKVVLDVPEEKENDEAEIEKGRKKKEGEGYFYYNTINGDIKNFIFDELNIRTTKITSTVSGDGKHITTRLIDRDLFVYEIKEHNKFNLLKNVSISLYFLNRSAKTIFSRRMGIQPVEYGSLFVYKNGFRIYPYGERGDDSLGIDNRALQSYNRYIGLRNLIGQFDIQGENAQLREATSRDAGMVKTKAFYQLTDTSPFADSLLLTTLKRLEKYVVDVTQWGINDENFEIGKSKEAKEGLVKLVSNIYDDKPLVEVSYNKDIINILDQKEAKSAKKLLANFKRVASESNDENLLKDAKKLEKRIDQQNKALEAAKKEIQNKEALGRETEKKLEFVESQNNFLQKDISDDTKNLESILHHIGLTTNLVKSDIENLVKAINKDASKEELVSIIKRLSWQNEKITSFSKYFKKANFNIHSNKLDVDIVSLTNEYLENVYKRREDLRINRELLNVKINVPRKFEHKVRFNPIDIIIVLDNLVSNSSKNGASKIELTWSKVGKTTQLSFKDDGKGISDSILDKVFEFGFTTSRRGSGIGLYHVKEIIEKLSGTIRVNNRFDKGVEFIFSFKN
jgi:signal transduction histidine kinase